MAQCKGLKRDRTPCRSPIVLVNGYCRVHQDQASEKEPLRWTRERLEAAIAAHGGPEGLDLAGADLSKLDLCAMDLHGIVLSRRDREKLRWTATNLEGAELRSANLQGADLRGVNLKEADLGGANLQGAELWDADLQGTRLTNAKVQGAFLFGANLRGAHMWAVNLQEADLRLADLRDVDLSHVWEGGLLGVRLYGARLDSTALRREELGSAIGDEEVGEYWLARDAYLALKQNFEDLGDYEAASWSYIKERQMEKACNAPWRVRWLYGWKQLGDMHGRKLPGYHPQVWWFYGKHTTKWLSDWLVELVCGYGERPWRTMATIILVFALFVGIYWATWAVMKVEKTIQGTVLVPTRNLVDLAIFGLGAFTTMDSKGLEPRAAWVQFLMGLEALLGIGLTGLLGFVLGNRIRRS